jgi:hypothetical protein
MRSRRRTRPSVASALAMLAALVQAAMTLVVVAPMVAAVTTMLAAVALAAVGHPLSPFDHLRQLRTRPMPVSRGCRIRTFG